jgi:hypothetical protein
VPNFGAWKKNEQILVRVPMQLKTAIYKAAESVDMSPPSLIAAIVTKFMEDTGYLDKPENWDLQELSDFLKDTQSESSYTEKG